VSLTSEGKKITSCWTGKRSSLLTREHKARKRHSKKGEGRRGFPFCGRKGPGGKGGRSWGGCPSTQNFEAIRAISFGGRRALTRERDGDRGEKGGKPADGGSRGRFGPAKRSVGRVLRRPRKEKPKKGGPGEVLKGGDTALAPREKKDLWM